MLSSSDDRTVRVWDLLTGHPIGRPLTSHTGAIWSIAAGNRHGRPVVVSGDADYRLRLWDLTTCEPLGRRGGPYRPAVEPGHRAPAG